MGVSSKLCIATAALIGFADGACADSWQHELTAVLWASGLDGQESIGPISVDVDASFSDLLEFVDVGGAVRFTAERDNIGWFIEASYVDLSADATVLSTRTTVDFGQTIAEGGLSVAVADHFALYGGARYQALDVEITNPVLRSIQRDVDWVDAIAGVRWTPLDGDAWRGWIRADAGAGGSDFQWLAEIGVAWRFATSWNAQLAYRTLDVDYASDSFGYDMRQSGLSLGLGMRF